MIPIYTPDNTNPAYQLNWGLTLFWRSAPSEGTSWREPLATAVEADGVRILKHRFTTSDASQFFLSTKPHVAPADAIRSVKGRLQHLIRGSFPRAFQRNHSIHSIGSARRSDVEKYVGSQMDHHRMADARATERLKPWQRAFDVDLGQCQRSSHGEYWHNLHIVFVNDRRAADIRDEAIDRVGEMMLAVSGKYGLRLSRLAILADHVHLVVGCQVDTSPQQIALRYLNNCAYALGMKRAYQFGYYVGTIGEYDRGAIR